MGGDVHVTVFLPKEDTNVLFNVVVFLAFLLSLNFLSALGGNTGNNINSAIMLLVSTTHKAEPTAQYQQQIMSQLQRNTQHIIQLSIQQLYIYCIQFPSKFSDYN